jgi:hypothetical protein
MKNRLVLLLLSAYFPLSIFSQQGPGGVGDTDGTGHLNYWIAANKGFSALPLTWTDQSGKAVINTINGIPALIPSSLNGLPVIRFNRNDGADFIVTSTSVNHAANPQADIYTVYRNDGSSNTGGLWGEDDGGWDRFILNDPGPGCANGISVGSGCTPVTGMNPVNIAVINAVHYNQGVAAGTTMQINGSTIAGFTTNHSSSSTAFTIGAIGAGGNYALNGDIAELIVFGTRRNTAEQILINNYLSAKYDIALSANDVYRQDDAINNNFDYNVAGIGRVDASNISNSGRGTGILRIDNATGLDDNEFLTWGDDNGSEQAVNNSDIPAGVQARFGKVWRASELNASGGIADVGAIDLQWDLSSHSPVTATDLRLLIDTDNDNSFSDETPIAGATLVTAGIYEFSAVTGISDSRRFTIGTANIIQTPLPVLLVFFKALSVNNSSVRLSWQTASETTGDHFEVERSVDNFNWENIAIIKAAGNSIVTNNYTTTDTTPHKGNSFYRLKQVDVDGSISYSAIQNVLINGTTMSIKVYPNPAGNYLIVKNVVTSSSDFTIFDQYGKNLSSLVGKQSNDITLGLRIDITALRPGIYFIRTQSGTSKFYKN